MFNNNMPNKKVELYKEVKKLSNDNNIKLKIKYRKSNINTLTKEKKRIEKVLNKKNIKKVKKTKSIVDTLNKDVNDEDIDLWFKETIEDVNNQEKGEKKQVKTNYDIIMNSVNDEIDGQIIQIVHNNNIDTDEITSLYVILYFIYSEERRERNFELPVINGIIDLDNIRYWLSGFDEPKNVKDVDIEYVSVTKKVKVIPQHKRDKRHNKMKQKSVKFIKLPYKINANNMMYKFNCVYEYLQHNAKKNYYINSLKEIPKNKEWTVQDIIDFCEENKINYVNYNYSLRVVNKNSFNKFKGLRFISANEHLYPVEKKEVTEMRKYFKKDNYLINELRYLNPLEIIDFTHKKIYETECLKHKSVTRKICLEGCSRCKHDRQILTYYDKVLFDGVLYTSNLELYNTFNMLKNNINNFDMIIPFNISVNRIFSYFFNKFNARSIGYDLLGKPQAVLYYNKRLDNEKKIKCIDKNKAYLSYLMRLKYIPVLDFSTEIKEYKQIENIDGYLENHNFNVYNFYYVESINRNMFGIIEPGKWYSGFRFQNIDDKSVFKVSKYIEPKLIKNFMKPLLKKCIAQNLPLTRDIINKFIGFSQIYNNNTNILIQHGLFKTENEAQDYANENEFEAITEIFNAKGKNLYTCKKNIEMKAKYTVNTGPLAFYIIDKCVNDVCGIINRMRKEDPEIKIIKIETDSISYISNKKLVIDIIDKNDIHKWKHIKFVKKEKSILRGTNFNYKPKQINYINYDESKNLIMKSNNFNQNCFFNCWAGSGKTYTVINDILPKINKDSYLILSCQHSALYEYRKESLNNSTLQKYINVLTGDKPIHYEYLIIDEAGLIDYMLWNKLFMNIRKDTKLICLGDNRQLNPVLNNQNKINFITFGNDYIMSKFDVFFEKTTNYRNNYSIENDYKKMLCGNYKLSDDENNLFVETNDVINNNNKKIKQFVYYNFKNNINPYIICYFNDTRNHINSLFTKCWTEYGKNKNDGIIKIKVGGIVTCTENDLFKKEIYNNTICIIKSFNKNKVELKYYDHNEGEYGDIIEITKQDYIKYFEPAYAFTLYKTQGRSINDDIILFCDKNVIVNKPTSLYTALSRRKQKIIVNKPENNNLKLSFH